MDAYLHSFDLFLLVSSTTYSLWFSWFVWFTYFPHFPALNRYETLHRFEHQTKSHLSAFHLERYVLIHIHSIPLFLYSYIAISPSCYLLIFLLYSCCIDRFNVLFVILGVVLICLDLSGSIARALWVNISWLDTLNGAFYAIVMLCIALFYLISGIKILRFLRKVTMVNTGNLRRVSSLDDYNNIRVMITIN